VLRNELSPGRPVLSIITKHCPSVLSFLDPKVAVERATLSKDSYKMEAGSKTFVLFLVTL
jgi:hypothetical protein